MASINDKDAKRTLWFSGLLFFLALFALPKLSTQVTTLAAATTETAPHLFLPLVVVNGAPPSSTIPPATPPPDSLTGGYPIVFVSRQIPQRGSVYYLETGSLPGVGPYTRFEVAAPGKLLVREANGSLRTLVDGSQPRAASLHLIDVNAPDVSYDGRQIVFAGLPQGNHPQGPMTNPSAWRIYVINADGTGLRQLTFADQNDLDLSQFGAIANQFREYDDTDPVWLPDGRLVFSSTRWPSYGMYGAARTSNLYVINADGANLHRITAERNGADRPLIDPVTGKIVYARWWRNFRVATNSMQTMANPDGGYIMQSGLLAINHSGKEGVEVGGIYNLERNLWFLATVNPDGTGLAQWAGRSNTTQAGQLANHAYGGAFAPNGTLYANFFPMTNGTEAAGFGGIRIYQRGPQGYTSLIGITTRDEDYYGLVRDNPPSHGVQKGAYAAEPEVLPDGRLLISWAPDIRQDYGLYVINPDGSQLTPLYNNPGTTELRTRLLRPRPQPPIIPDQVTQVADRLPPLAQGPYDKDGVFTFAALNVYFNAPVDADIINAMPVGSAGTIRFFIDHQRHEQQGSHEGLDWPILLQELAVNPDGSVTATSPANVPLFEQIRSPQPDYRVPLVGRAAPLNEKAGAAHVAGLNFGRPGEVQRCVGCHAGHSMIAVPTDPEAARWTNLAPGAVITVSSFGGGSIEALIDRRVLKGKSSDPWRSDPAQDPNQQWIELTFPTPITVRTVRLYNPRQSAAGQVSTQVQQATVKLYADAAAQQPLAVVVIGPLTTAGTDAVFNDVRARRVRVDLNAVTGAFENQLVASLAEIEVIARGEAGP